MAYAPTLESADRPVDPAEQMLANLALSVTCCHLQNEAQAKAHVARAQTALNACSTHMQTLRPSCVLKMVRLRLQIEGVATTALLPLIGRVMLSPSPTPECTHECTQPWNGDPVSVGHMDFDVGYYRMRLRIARLQRDFACLTQIASLERLCAAAQELFHQCTYGLGHPVAPLDLADDYLTVACHFVRSRNLPMARLALEKAGGALRGVETILADGEYHHRICRIGGQIASLKSALTSLAS